MREALEAEALLRAPEEGLRNLTARWGELGGEGRARAFGALLLLCHRELDEAPAHPHDQGRFDAIAQAISHLLLSTPERELLSPMPGPGGRALGPTLALRFARVRPALARVLGEHEHPCAQALAREALRQAPRALQEPELLGLALRAAAPSRAEWLEICQQYLDALFDPSARPGLLRCFGRALTDLRQIHPGAARELDAPTARSDRADPQAPLSQALALLRSAQEAESLLEPATARKRPSARALGAL